VTQYRDSSGRTLEDYPRPSVAVDTAVLTVPPDGTLSVVLVRDDDGWRLPGTFLHPGERLREAALRSLRDKAGIVDLEPRLLEVFDDPDRDDRGWVLSVAHIAAAAPPRLTLNDSTTRVVPVDAVPALPYDHDRIVERAAEELRADYRRVPDPARFLERPFTLRQLRKLHERVLGRDWHRDSFRRLMEPQVQATGEIEVGTVGRPARLWWHQ
jgi:8-oxo-dGTP diphosphatase